MKKFYLALAFVTSGLALNAQGCIAPAGFDIQRTSDTEATLVVANTEDPSNIYDIFISVNGQNSAPNSGSSFTPGSVANDDITMPNSRATLNPSSTYDVWIRKDCGNGEVSAWVGPVHVPLYVPGCQNGNVTAQRVGNTATFGTDAPSWDMYLDIFNRTPSPAANPRSAFDNRSGIMTRANLNPSRTYYVWFRTDCDPQNNNTYVGDWEGPYTLAPAPLAVQLNAGTLRVDNFDVATAQVVSINGRSQAVNVTNNEVNTSSLAPGKYILNVTDANGKTESLSFIKK